MSVPRLPRVGMYSRMILYLRATASPQLVCGDHHTICFAAASPEVVMIANACSSLSQGLIRANFHFRGIGGEGGAGTHTGNPRQGSTPRPRSPARSRHQCRRLLQPACQLGARPHPLHASASCPRAAHALHHNARQRWPPPGLGHARHILKPPLGVEPRAQESNPHLLADRLDLGGGPVGGMRASWGASRRGATGTRSGLPAVWFFCGTHPACVQLRSWAAAAVQRATATALSTAPPRTRAWLPTPSARPSTWYRWLLTSAHVLCSVFSVAPLSSNCPPGSSVTLCPAWVSPMMLPPSMMGCQLNRSWIWVSSSRICHGEVGREGVKWGRARKTSG